MTCWKDHALTLFRFGARGRSPVRGRARTLRGIGVALLLGVVLAGGTGCFEAWCGLRRASAQATNVEKRALATADEVAEVTRGPKFNLTAGAFFRSPSDHVGFSIAGDFYYNFRLGPLVLAPGGRLTGYLIRDFYAIAP